MLYLTGCDRQAFEQTTSADAPTGSPAGPYVEISLSFNHRSGIASNQFAVWIENNEGEFIKSLFVTHFAANGGWKNRPDALPFWAEKSGLSTGTAQTADAVSGATPKSGQQSYIWDCTDESGQTVVMGEYHFIVEGIIFWKDAVLYNGVINVNSEESTATAAATYTTDESKQSDMITDVKAVYRP